MKTLTLPALIRYIEKNYITEEKKNKNDITLGRNKTMIDEIEYRLLECGEIKYINDLPNRLKRIFEPFTRQIKRQGNISNKNISIFETVIKSMLIENNKNNSNTQKELIIENIKIIEEIKEILKEDIKSYQLYDTYIKYNWKKEELIKSIDELINNKLSIKFLADYFKINIIILDIIDDKLYYVNCENSLDVYRPMILLSYYKEEFELLYKEIKNNDEIIKQYKFNYSDDVTKKLLNVEIENIFPFDNIFIDNNENNENNINYVDNNCKNNCENNKIYKSEDNKYEEFIDNNNNNYESETFIESEEENHNINEIFIKKENNKDNKKNKLVSNDTNLKIERLHPQAHASERLHPQAHASEQKNKSSTSSSKINKYKKTKKELIIENMKIHDLQKIAINNNINIYNGKYKNGNNKAKTKKELIKEIKNIKNNKYKK